VRAVRGGQSDNSFIDNSDGTVTDTNSGLMWQKDTAPGTYTWQQALAYCENLTLAGHTDWRLPNRSELQTLVNYNWFSPSIDRAFFPDTARDFYWSSTTFARLPYCAWGVFFIYGHVSYSDKPYNARYYVRAVRYGGEVNVSANEHCNPQDVFNTSPDNLESMYIAGTLPIPAGTCMAYLVRHASCGDIVMIPVCSTVAEKAIQVDSNGHFCDLLWTPPAGDNNLYDLLLDVNNDGMINLAVDYMDSAVTAGAATTLVKVSSFTAIPKMGIVIIRWKTESETSNAGFNLYRAESENSEYVRINDSLIPATGSSTQGATYEFIDGDLQNRKIYYYKLEDIDLSGTSTMHGTVSAMPSLIYRLFGK
jgi:hypothetical protein